MYVLKNALISITRNKGRNILIGIIIVVISFKGGESFRILIISSNELNEGNYKLYTGGKNTGELVNNVYVGGKYTKGTLLQEVNVK